MQEVVHSEIQQAFAWAAEHRIIGLVLRTLTTVLQTIRALGNPLVSPKLEDVKKKEEKPPIFLFAIYECIPKGGRAIKYPSSSRVPAHQLCLFLQELWRVTTASPVSGRVLGDCSKDFLRDAFYFKTVTADKQRA